MRALWKGDLPSNTVLHNRLIGDEDGVDLFRRCALVVLPYTDATQSAVVAAAYFFKKPVIVSRSGALAEYVVEGETGFTVEPGQPSSLARIMASALRSPDKLQEMGAAGRVWYDRRRYEELESLKGLYYTYDG